MNRQQRWYYNNKDAANKKARLYQATFRPKLVSLLGGQCARCGLLDIRALQVDHINGGGARERKALGNKTSIYRYYSKRPEEAKAKLQVLCANCNWIKRFELGERGAKQAL